jgi:hypothetical protein
MDINKIDVMIQSKEIEFNSWQNHLNNDNFT